MGHLGHTVKINSKVVYISNLIIFLSVCGWLLITLGVLQIPLWWLYYIYHARRFGFVEVSVVNRFRHIYLLQKIKRMHFEEDLVILRCCRHTISSLFFVCIVRTSLFVILIQYLSKYFYEYMGNL